ncbi:MAG: ATP-binding protein [Pseudomonadota bacterium]
MALIIGALTGVVGLLMVRLLLGPIRSLARYARSVRSAQNGGAEPPRHLGTRELHGMAEAVVDMADTLRAREAAIRVYSDHVTHQLKSPVSAIAAASELLHDNPDLGNDEKQLTIQIMGAAREMEHHLDALRSMARAREADYFGQTVLAEILPSLQASYPALEVKASGGDTRIPLSTDGLKLILRELLDNALAHGADRTVLTAAQSKGWVSLTVADNGHGISEGNLPKIFEPFFSTRRDEGGTGMGLSIISAILAAHRSKIHAIGSNDGATFLIEFGDTR